MHHHPRLPPNVLHGMRGGVRLLILRRGRGLWLMLVHHLLLLLLWMMLVLHLLVVAVLLMLLVLILLHWLRGGVRLLGPRRR